MSYFINGQFWQSDSVPAEHHGRLVLKSREIDALFFGFIGREQMALVNGAEVDGFMNDLFGRSAITNFILKGNTLTFMKTYDREGSVPASYKLQRSVSNEIGNEFFAGDWKTEASGIVTAQGKARCVLTPIPEHFYVKPA